MKLSVHVHLDYELAGPTDLLLQIEAADIPEQAIEWKDLILPQADHIAHVPAQTVSASGYGCGCPVRWSSTIGPG